MEAEQVKASNEHVQKTRELVLSTSNLFLELKDETSFKIEKNHEPSFLSNPSLELKDETPFIIEKTREASSPSNPTLELKDETPFTIEKAQDASSLSNLTLELKDETPFTIEKIQEDSSDPLELKDEKPLEASSLSNPNPVELRNETLFTTERTTEACTPSNPPLELKHVDETREITPSNPPLEPPDNASAKPNQSDEDHRISWSPCEDTTTSEPTEMKSPPIQTMAQTPGYDPNRIPASIFSSKTGPGDWSATSNESLFSIHMGNNSFSRDYAILFGKSGELPKLDDWNGPQTNPFVGPGELPRLEEWNKTNHHHVSNQGRTSEFGTLPPVLEESGVLSGEFPKKYEDVSPKFVSGQTIANHGNRQDVPAARKPPLPENSHSSLNNPAAFPSPSRLSDASAHSGSSFAFPVLAGNDSGKNDTLKVVPEKLDKPVKAEQPVEQNQSHLYSETPTNITSTRWFSCFSHWPRFC